MSPRLKSSMTSTDSRLAPKRWGLMTLVIGGVLTAIVSVAGLSAGASESSDTLAASAATTQAKAAAATKASTTAKTTAAVTKEVMIENYKYSPAALTVAVGDTVKWTNMDTAPHTVTVTSGPVKFNSGNLAKGESFSYTFKTAGTYKYYCAVHPDMTASVTVTGSTTPTPTPTTPTPTPTTPTPTDPDAPMPPMGGDACRACSRRSTRSCSTSTPRTWRPRSRSRSRMRSRWTSTSRRTWSWSRTC